MREARLLRIVPVIGSVLSRSGPVRAGGVAQTAAQPKPRLLDQVRATILALARFGMAPEAEVKALEKRWKKYRQATGCDLDGKPNTTGGQAR